MKITILGSAAGGGFPQWNCGCPGCREVRSGSGKAIARTQDSVAVCDGEDVHLLNASPDILSQIRDHEILHPRRPRHSPIRSIVLTNGDLDHVLGLFSLRESYPLVIYATDQVRRGLTQNAIFRTLERFPEQVTWRRLELGKEMPLAGKDGESRLSIRAFPVPGKRPVHLMTAMEASPEDSIGVVIRDGDRSLAYVSSAGGDGGHTGEMARATTTLFDGTFWTSDELIRLGLGTSRAEDMAHWPISGDGGSLARLSDRLPGRKIFTHVNNTNPMLISGSQERRDVELAGWEIAFDGMTLSP